MLDASLKRNLIKTENLWCLKTRAIKAVKWTLRSFLVLLFLFVLHKRIITEEFDFMKR